MAAGVVLRNSRSGRPRLSRASSFLAGAKLAQGILARAEVIKARFESFDGEGRDVNLARRSAGNAWAGALVADDLVLPSDRNHARRT